MKRFFGYKWFFLGAPMVLALAFAALYYLLGQALEQSFPLGAQIGRSVLIGLIEVYFIIDAFLSIPVAASLTMIVCYTGSVFGFLCAGSEAIWKGVKRGDIKRMVFVSVALLLLIVGRVVQSTWVSWV